MSKEVAEVLKEEHPASSNVSDLDMQYADGEEDMGELKLYDSLENSTSLSLENKVTMEELKNQLKQDLNNFITNENLNSKEDMIAENFGAAIMPPELLESGIADSFMDDFDAVYIENERSDPVADSSKVNNINGDVCVEGTSKSELMTIDEKTIDTTDVSDKPYKCHICDKVFSRSSSLKCHVRLHIEGPDNMLRNGNVFNTVVPTEIDKLYTNEDDSAIPDDTNDPADPTNPYSCVFCEKRFSRKSALKSHMQFHVTPFPSIKDDPSEAQINNANDEHMFIDSNEFEKVVSTLSEEVGNSFADEKPADNLFYDSQSENDSNSPAGKREYKCIFCGKCFSRKSSLTFHYKFHPAKTDDLRIELERNGIEKELMENENLVKGLMLDIDEPDAPANESVASQPNEKPYQCHVCDKQFSRNSSLVWHLKLHKLNDETKTRKKLLVASTPENNLTVADSDPLAEANNSVRENGVHSSDGSQIEFYRCELCDRVFDRASSLKRHMISHKTEVGNEIYLCDSAENNKEKVAEKITEMYKCDMCSRSFDKINALRRHSALHSRSDVNGSESLSYLRTSTDQVDENGLYKCTHCDRTFERLKGLYRHKSIHKDETNAMSCDENDTGAETEDEEFRCDKCDRIFCQASSLKKHMHSHNSNASTNASQQENVTGSYVCGVCDRTFSKIHGFRRHMAFHKQQNHDSVDGQENTNQGEDMEEDDEEINEEEECFEAVIGDQTFYCNTKKHQHAEDSLTLYKCDQCDKCFCTVGNVKRHITKYHKPDSTLESSAYDTNEEETDAENTIVENRRSDVKFSNFRCPICKKIFAANSSLKRHVLTHDKDEPNSAITIHDEEVNSYTCEICDRIFGDKNGLKRHVAYHPKAEDILEPIKLTNNFKDVAGLFKCGICNKAFNHTGILKRHVMYHISSSQSEHQTSKRFAAAFQCKKCPQSFPSRESLKKHLISHGQCADQYSGNSQDEDERCHDCTFCDRSFVSENALEKHHHAVHQHQSNKTHINCEDDEADANKSFQCDTCKRFFVGKRALRIHMSYHTRNLIDEFPVTSKPKLVPASDGTYYCDKCNRSFPSMKGIARHSSVHKHENQSFEEHAAAETSEGSVNFENADALPHKCNNCDRTFKNLKALAKHLFFHKKKDGVSVTRPKVWVKEEVGELSHICENCSRGFKNLKALAKHLNYCKVKLSDLVSQNDTDSTLHTCKNCGKSFINAKALVRHSACHQNNDSTISLPAPDENEGVIKCDICNRCFDNFKDLVKHSSCHSVNTVSDLGSVNGELIEPKKEVTPNTQTEDSTVPNDCLSEEKETVSGIDDSHPYKCNSCDRTFDRIKGLKRHSAYHKASDSSGLTNTSALDTTSSDRNIVEPYEEVNDKTDGSFQCDSCDRTFSMENSLKRHSALHGKVEKVAFSSQRVTYTCDTCQEPFPRSSQLRRHVLEHHQNSDSAAASEEDPRHKCKTCDKEFPKARALSMHKMHHRKEKSLPNGKQESMDKPVDGGEDMDYECVYCEKCFSVKDDLLNHVKEHKEADTEEETDDDTAELSKTRSGTVISQKKCSYKCDSCDRTFTMKCHLVVHARTHKKKADATEVALPYKCNTCGKRFQFKSNLAIHIQFHVSGKSYNCEYCDKSFDTKGLLKKHEMIHVSGRVEDHDNSDECLDDEEEMDSANEGTKVEHFRCDECGEMFLEACALERHTKEHIENVGNDETK